MSFNKAIEHNKEKREPYRKSKAFDSSCRNHGQCSYCVDNRTYSYRKSLDAAKDKLEDYNDEDNYDRYIEEQKELDKLNEIFLNEAKDTSTTA